jgi:acyl-CoA synthetase (AMP-forming)/AMP-acid ligase II
MTVTTKPFPTIVHRLRALHADQATGRVTHVAHDGTEDPQPYTRLWEEARCALGGLRAAGADRGDRVVLLLAPGREFLATLWGCLLGGVVPAVINAPANLVQDNEPKRKLDRVWALLGEPLLLVPDRAARWFDGTEDIPLAGAAFRTYGEIAASSPGDDEALPDPADVAFLQFSSGSTSTPKGVVLTHANLAANLEDMCTRMRMSPADTMMTWLPDSHDMGLIGTHFMPMWAGASQVKMAPLTFLRRPRLWLEKTTEHRGTVAVGPQFAVDYLLQHVLAGQDTTGLDLSSLRLYVNGAEPISAPALRAFQRLAEPLGFGEATMFPVYGLAEATLAVTMPTVGEKPYALRLDRAAFARGDVVPSASTEPGETIEFVRVGRPLDSMEVRVVGEDGGALGEHQVGHVLVRGPSVASRYAHDHEASAETFAGGWLRTGDQGMFDGDCLVITGRIKDVIFVKGENVYAHDLEWQASELGDIRAGEVAACGCTDPETSRERVLLFVKSRGRARYEPLLELRQALFMRLGFPVDYILPVSSLPKTTSGKLQRSKLRERFLEGGFAEEVAAWEEAAAERARRVPSEVS